MDKSLENNVRSRLAKADRVVVKMGTRLLTTSRGRPDPKRMGRLAKEIAVLQKEGREVVIVSSGAIGMGLGALGRTTRPKDLSGVQAAAAIGQVLLMAHYEKVFRKEGLLAAQVLLTHDDFNSKKRRLNARNTIRNLISNRVIPIINENDVISADEIKVGDNDTLAALSANLIDADALILLTTVNGYREPSSSGRTGRASRTKRVSHITQVTKRHLGFARGAVGVMSVGGMTTKLKAAQLLQEAGANRQTLILDGRKQGALKQAFEGKDIGTIISRN